MTHTRRRWRKLGKIFDPSLVSFGHGVGMFAQSPQALVLSDRIRVFFSTRVVDESGKYLSNVMFADFSNDLRSVLQVSSAPVIELGKLGCFDEHGIFPMNMLAHDGRVFGYTSGWSRRVSVSVETAIGLAISTDNGITFQRIGDGPVLGPSLSEPFLVGDPFVQMINRQFHMWYIFGTEWRKIESSLAPERTYRIGHAMSDDGANWIKDDGHQIVPTRIENECQALPTVIFFDGLYHMFFCYRNSFDFRTNASNGYRIGHASSSDLQRWTRGDDDIPLEITPQTWDSDMQCYPHVFSANGEVYLLYNGNAFGKFGFGLAVLE